MDVVSAPTHSGAGEAWGGGGGCVCGIGWMWFQHPRILVQVRYRAGCVEC